MFHHLCLLLLTATTSITSHQVGVNFDSFSNQAFSGKLKSPFIASTIGVVPLNLKKENALAFRWTGSLTITKGLYIFSLRSSNNISGFARLWIDDHLLLDDYLDNSSSPYLEARYSIPIPFWETSSRVKLEYVVPRDLKTKSTPLQLVALFANSSEITAQSLSTNWPKAELTYSTARVDEEQGWNTWLDMDLLTHALLPHGLALSLSFKAAQSGTTSSQLGTPSCNRTMFPAKHGLHARRGEYTEIEEFEFDGEKFRIESATDPSDVSTNLILITRLTKVVRSTNITISINASVPSVWAPRSCTITTTNSSDPPPVLLSATCPGLPPVVVRAVTDSLSSSPTITTIGSNTAATSIDVLFPTSTVSVAFVAYAAASSSSFFNSSSSSSSSSNYTLNRVQAIIALRRSTLQARFKTMAASAMDTTTSNETAAGLATSIAWNVVYTSQEGIIAPVFRGSVWGLDRGSGYVLFEWDTMLSGWMSLYVDSWLAKSHLIRMVKSMVFDSTHGGGFVAGFWNGHCGTSCFDLIISCCIHNK